MLAPWRPARTYVRMSGPTSRLSTIRPEATTPAGRQGAMRGAVSWHRLWPLLFAEGVHGLEAGSARSRGVTGGERDEGEEGDSGAHCQGIAGLHAVDEGGGGTAGPGGETDADGEAEGKEQSRLAKDQADDTGPGGAKGDADPDFVAATLHHVGNDAIQSEDGEHTR